MSPICDEDENIVRQFHTLNSGCLPLDSISLDSFIHQTFPQHPSSNEQNRQDFPACGKLVSWKVETDKQA